MTANKETPKFLDKSNIVCGLKSSDWQQAIGEIIAVLDKNEGGFDRKEVAAACFERELASSTVLAPGIAIPHARVERLDKLLVGVGVTRSGVEFPAQDRGKVHAIIVILTPKSEPGLYLQALAALTKVLDRDNAAAALSEAESPKAVYRFFTTEQVELPPYLKARDLMQTDFSTLQEGDHLGKTIHAFCSKGLLDIPVVDEEGDLRGLVTIEDILRLSLPEHLLWLHDLSPILHFEPFAELLRSDGETKVADFMGDDFITVQPEVPAIQLAKMFLTSDARIILVVEKRRLLGIVGLGPFMADLFWR